jgi:hypothetical protein
MESFFRYHGSKSKGRSRRGGWIEAILMLDCAAGQLPQIWCRNNLIAKVSLRHGKGSAYSLTLIGVRVLAENDHANVLEGAVLESTEYVLLDRVDALAFLSQGNYLRQHFAALSASEYRLPAAVALHPNLPLLFIGFPEV